MIGLPSGKETMTIFSAVFVENRNATDRQQMYRQTELLYQYRTSICYCWRV